MLRLETIAIGDELLTGKTSDTNTTFVSECLFAKGFRLERTTVILDDIETIRATVRERAKECEYVFCFGGLGPTTDDLTAEAIAGVIGGKLVEFEPARRNLVALFERLKRQVTPAALKQALYPASAEPIPNSVGLAPGFACSVGKCRFYFLPGVPKEMKAMVTDWVLPDIWKRAGVGAGEIAAHSWRMLGIPESELQTRMNEVQASLPPDMWLGYRTQNPENHLTLYARSAGGKATAAFEALKERIRGVVAPWCYTEGLKELEAVVVEELKNRRQLVATAESCTAGLAAQRLTRIPGASEYVWGGVNVYRVEAKQALLGVQVGNVQDAVSADVTLRLAEALEKKSSAQICAAITGSLGPAPANDKDPLGTIYLSVVGGGKAPLQERLVLPVRTREETQWSGSSYLLGAVLRFLRQ